MRALPSASVQNPFEIVIDHDPAGTIASIRNQNAQRATGDWLCFLDADDQLAQGYLRAMQQAWGRRSRGRASTLDGPPLLLTPAVSYVIKGRRQLPRFLKTEDLRHSNYLVVGTLVKRDLFLEVGGFEDYPHGFEDWSIWAKCWKAGAQIVPVRKAVYIAYVNEDSKRRKMWRDKKYQAKWHEKVQRDLWPEMYE